MNRRSIALAVALAFLWSASVPLKAQKAAPPTAPTTRSEPVNLNTANAAQLATLPGIGPKTADLIIQYRQKAGGFKKIEEVMNVRGIGEKSFLKFKSLITVTPPKTDRAAGGTIG
jgi:competence protein ComEA